jgi:D-threo-aldose 1-dehydrogenase
MERKLSPRNLLGKTGLSVPRVVFGTSYLGNLYKALAYEEKLELIRMWFACAETPVIIDTAGKYGAGLALEVIGRGLSDLGVDPEEVLISNKLGWYRIPLEKTEPTFEPGAWVDLAHDCRQAFGYEGIMRCFEQGNELLGGKYLTDLVSVHDPDEYLLAAKDPADRDHRWMEVLESYRALFDLKSKGKVQAVGIGSKDWTIIRELYKQVPFDWVMLANSFTLFSHPREILEFMDRLEADGVGIINSAVFHGGFLTGGDKFDYREVDPSTKMGKFLHDWRERFHRVCFDYGVDPGEACIHFSLSHPAIAALALNTSRPAQMTRNVEILQKEIPPAFWKALNDNVLIDQEYPYLKGSL